jgi:glycine oxidase
MSDILVIGGGIIGLLTARELIEAGERVTVVEMGETGREASWAGGGILSPLYPWRYPQSVTDLVAWSQQDYPRLCLALHDETGIDPELTHSGILILDPEERDQAQRWAQAQGVRLELPDLDAVREIEPDLGPHPDRALWLPEVAQVRNPRLTKALRRAIDGRAEVREQEEVTELLVEAGRVTGARTRKDTFRADKVIVCTGAWTARLLEQLGNAPDIHPVRGQMILFYGKPGQIGRIVLYRDHYVIPRRDGRVLFGSTVESVGFHKATSAEVKEALYRAAIELFPLLKRTPIEEHWSGLRPGSPSGVPYIGAYPGVEGLYFNAGHFRNGVVTGPASARLAADLMLGREPLVSPAPYALDAAR